MTKLEILTTNGTTNGSYDLPETFLVEPKKELLHQAVVAYLANARQSTAHTKTRGEVSGGGRKPWKQKGTGRARVGSSRSPLWRGGGITFGPISGANASKRLPSKMKRLARSMALSARIRDSRIMVIDNLSLNEPKTREAAALVQRLCPAAKSVLFILDKPDSVVTQAFRNLPATKLTTANDLNTYDILSFDYLIFTKPAIEQVEKYLTKQIKR